VIPFVATNPVRPVTPEEPEKPVVDDGRPQGGLRDVAIDEDEMLDVVGAVRDVPVNDVPVNKDEVVDVVGIVRVSGLPRVCTLCERLRAGGPYTNGVTEAEAVLVPGSTSSVEPNGSPVLAGAVPVPIAGMGDALAVEPQMLGIDKSVEVGLTDVVAVTPPPSKVEGDPPAEPTVPLGRHAVLLATPALVVTPTVVGPRPPGLIPTAPMGMPVGPAGAVGVRGEAINAGEVAVVLCARLGPLSESVAIVMATSKRAVGSLWSSRIGVHRRFESPSWAKPRRGAWRGFGGKAARNNPCPRIESGPAVAVLESSEGVGGLTKTEVTGVSAGCRAGGVQLAGQRHFVEIV
jgi:hypothetical protein